MVLDGKALAQTIKERIKKEAVDLEVTPGLAVILIGDHWESKLYIKQKRKACEELGFNFYLHEFPVNVTEKEVLDLIEELNQDQKVHGLLVQLPLPMGTDLDLLEIQEAIDPWKDVDGFNPINRGLLMTAREKIPSGTMIPCTAKGCLKLIQETKVEIKGKKVVVVGRSNIVGKPVAQLLLQQNATVTVCHSQTVDLAYETKQADVLIVAVGHPKLITKNMVKPGVIVIDVGINRTESGLVGDVDFEAVKDVAAFITPVPGGVGPMTVTCLLENLVLALQSSKQSF